MPRVWLVIVGGKNSAFAELDLDNAVRHRHHARRREASGFQLLENRCALFAFYGLRLKSIPFLWLNIPFNHHPPLTLAGVGRLFFASPGGQIIQCAYSPLNVCKARPSIHNEVGSRGIEEQISELDIKSTLAKSGQGARAFGL